MTSLSGSGRDLAAEYRVGYDAIRRATALRERGLIVTLRGYSMGPGECTPGPVAAGQAPSVFGRQCPDRGAGGRRLGTADRDEDHEQRAHVGDRRDQERGGHAVREHMMCLRERGRI